MERDPSNATDRRVRVFISSTFRDMHAERDHLVTVVFPELRERCERLGLEFFDMDLQVFLADKQFEACDDLVITDEIRVVIAAQACLLLLHRDTDYYPDLKSILVYPSTYFSRVREEVVTSKISACRCRCTMPNQRSQSHEEIALFHWASRQAEAV